MKKQAARARNSGETQGAILRAAENEFAEKGFSGARVDKIAASAGVNKALLYHYFHDKHRLYATVLERLMKRVAEKLSGVVVGLEGDRAENVLRKVFAAYFDVVKAEPAYARLFIREAAAGWETIREIEDAGTTSMVGAESVDTTLGALLPVLARGAAAGELRGDLDFTFLISMAGAFCRFSFLLMPRLQLLYPAPLDNDGVLARARDQIIELFLNGIIARGAAPANN